jgi:hypothetical protein
MPKIPTYDALQVRDQALPQVYQSDARADLIPAIGNGRLLSKAGAAIGDLANSMDKMREQDDATAVFQAETVARNNYLKFQAEARKRQGINATGLTTDTEKFWEEQAQGASLTTDRQRELFIKRLTPLRMSSVESMGTFEFNEKRAANLEGAKASMASAIELAAANPLDPNIRRQALDTIRQNATWISATNGETPEAQAQNMLTYTNTLHASVVQKLVDTDVKAAQAYMAEYGDQMTTKTKLVLDGQIQEGVVIRTAQDESDKYEAQVATGKMTEQDVLQDISARFEGKTEEAVKMEYKRRVADQDAMREKGQKAAADEAWKIFESTGRMSAIPPSLRAKMDGRDLRAIKHEAQAMSDRAARAAEGAGERKFPKTDWEVYGALRQKAFDGKLDMRLISQNFEFLGAKERETLIDLATNKKGNSGELKAIATIDQQVNAQTDALKIKDEDKGKFRALLYSDLEDQQRAKGRELTFTERQQRIDYWLTEGKIPGTLWGTSGRRFELQGNENFNDFTAPGEAPRIKPIKAKPAGSSDPLDTFRK